MIHRVSFRKITIVRTRMPAISQVSNISPEEDAVQHEVNEELQWLGSSLGLFGLRDRDKSCFRIFVEFLKAAKEKRTLTSNEIAATTGLARGTVIHHLKTMLSSGIITPSSKGYHLRMQNLEKLIDEIEKDAAYACSQLRQVAKKVDNSIGLG